MGKRARPVAAAILLALCTLSGGCYDAKSVDNRTMVYALGLDAAAGGQFTLTADATNPQPLGGGGATGGGGSSSGSVPSQSVLFKATSASISEASAEIQLQSPKDLDFVNLGVIVFSKELAQRGISVPVDYLLSGAHTRVLAWTLVVDGSASELLKFKPKTTTRSAYRDLIQAQGNLGAETPEILSEPLWKVYRDSINREADPVMPLIRIDKDKIAFVGSALFHDAKMTGTLTPEQTQLFAMLTQAKSRGTVQLSLPDGGLAILKLIDVEASIRMKPGPVVALRLTSGGRLVERTSGRGTPTPRELQQLQTLAEQKLATDSTALYNMLAQADCDGFGIGGVLRAQDPHLWDSLRTSWPEPLKSIPVDVQVQVKIASPEL